MTAVSGEKIALKSKVKIGRVRWSILAMLFVVTMVNYADRSTLSIAGDAIQKTSGHQRGDHGLPVLRVRLDVPDLPDPVGLPAGPVRREEGVQLRDPAVVGIHHGAGRHRQLHAATAVGLLFLLRLLVGLFEGPSFPGNSKIVAAWFPTKERGIAAAIFNSAQYFATAAFPPLMGWLVVSAGLAARLHHVGGIGVVFGLLWIVVIYAPRNHPRVSQAELDYIRAGGALVTWTPVPPLPQKPRAPTKFTTSRRC